MNPALTLCYVTARKEPQFGWFAASLARETHGDFTNLHLLVIDFYADAHKEGDGWNGEQAAGRIVETRKLLEEAGCPPDSVFVSAPIWNVWQGPYRLTKENWFAKADYLNAAIALCSTDYLACVDDLSVLMPGWLAAAREAVQFPGITCGAYRKVRGLEVVNGEVTKYRDFKPGIDSRWNRGSDRGGVPCDPGMMYGCSFVVPVEAALKVNGWPHYSHGMGYEDCATGRLMAKHGFPFRYDRRLLTVESDEHHFIGKQMRREDPGRSPEDKSHVLEKMSFELMSFPQSWPAGDTLRSIRAKALADPARQLPVILYPATEPFTGRKLADLGEQEGPKPIKLTAAPVANAPAIAMPQDVQAKIVKAHAMLQGWCPMDKALLLCAEIEALKPDLIVEIGVFGGKSLIPMLVQLAANGKGHAVAIDPWNNEAASEGYGGTNLTYWQQVNMPQIRYAFGYQLKALKLDHLVTIEERKSDEITPPGPIDFLHIDGQHTDQAIRDVDRFASKVRAGGLCCLNDMDWEGGMVQCAASRLLELGFVENYKCGTGSMYRRTHLPS